MPEEKSQNENESQPFSVDRRSLLKAGGVVSLASALGSATTTRAQHQRSRDVVHVVGPNAEFRTIQAAYDALNPTGGRIRVTHEYDSEPESFPIEMNRTTTDGNGIPFILEGDDLSGSRIDASGSMENALEIVGPGLDYQRKVLIRNIQIQGGQTGVTLQRCPYSRMENVILNGCDRHGVNLAADTVGNYGFSFENVEAWGCGRNGFRLEENSHPNAVTFTDCEAILCGRTNADFAGVHLRNSSVRWIGGVIQQNYGHGMDLRNSNAPYIGGVYFEGNGIRSKAPLDIYLGATNTDSTNEGPGVYAATIEGCYFNGKYYYQDHVQGREMALRALNVQKTFGGEISTCAYQNYDESFIAIFGDSKTPNADVQDFDLNHSSHRNVNAAEQTPFISTENGYRLRDSGTIRKQNLAENTVRGLYDGDTALHTGNGYPQHAIWSESDSVWYLPDGSTV